MSETKSEAAPSTATRKRRPTPARQEPIRPVAGAVRAPKVRQTSTPAVVADDANDGVVESAVKNAYRVFEDYMKRGEQAAWSACPPHSRDSTMGQDGKGAADDAMRFWQDMWNAYTRNVQSMMQNVPGMPDAANMPWGFGSLENAPWGLPNWGNSQWRDWFEGTLNTSSTTAWDRKAESSGSSSSTTSGGGTSDGNLFEGWAPSAEAGIEGWAIDDSKTSCEDASDSSNDAAAEADSTQGVSDATPDEIGRAAQKAMAEAFGRTVVSEKDASAEAPQAISVSVETANSRRAEVSFATLRVATGDLTLSAITIEGGKSKLSKKAAKLVPTDDGVRIALNIFASQKAGTYTGCVQNADGQAVGNLKVVIEAVGK